MNFERIKSNLNSVLSHVNEDRMSQDIKNAEIIKLVTEALEQLNKNELDVIDAVNNNIKELVREIISTKRWYRRGCCYGSLIDRPECSGNCDECIDNYYNKMYKDKIEKYKVSAE